MFNPQVRRVWMVVWWLDRIGGMERHVTELACALRCSAIGQAPLLRETGVRR